MIERHTSPIYIRRGLLGLAIVCAFAGNLLADPGSSREYPPTYSSRKAAWYDPNRWLTPKETKTTTEPMPVITSGPSNSSPAWKWYGYGTPTPGNNPLAPNGAYSGVPGNWYPTVGATPGAVPSGATPGVIADAVTIVPTPSRVEKPLIVVPPVEEPAPRIGPPSTSVEWKSSSASIRVPEMPAQSRPTLDGPRASLKAPVKVDAVVPSPPSAPPAPRTPLDHISPAGRESPDLPVETAPGIVAPPQSMVPRHETYRARSPEGEIPDAVTTAVKRACGPDVRVLEIGVAGPKAIVLRLAGSLEAAKAARERLAREHALDGWRIGFERVTMLRN